MKTLLLAAALVLSAAATAKSLEISVPNVRNDKGAILVMAVAAGSEQPVYAMSPAAKGTVTVTLQNLDADTAEVSLFHDEDGDFKMKQGERGPVEGYATKKCKLPDAQNTVQMKIYYPAE